MARSIQLHPLSVLIGFGIALMAFVTLGQAAPVVAQRVGIVGSVQVAPHPRDIVLIVPGTPYLVPAGKILSITALGAKQGASNVYVTLVVDGNSAVTASADISAGSTGVSMKPLPHGPVAGGGSIVEVSDNFSGAYGRAWGYLVDA